MQSTSHAETVEVDFFHQLRRVQSCVSVGLLKVQI